jgi:hypothetical protein
MPRPTEKDGIPFPRPVPQFINQKQVFLEILSQKTRVSTAGVIFIQIFNLFDMAG